MRNENEITSNRIYTNYIYIYTSIISIITLPKYRLYRTRVIRVYSESGAPTLGEWEWAEVTIIFVFFDRPTLFPGNSNSIAAEFPFTNSFQLIGRSYRRIRAIFSDRIAEHSFNKSFRSFKLYRFPRFIAATENTTYRFPIVVTRRSIT